MKEVRLGDPLHAIEMGFQPGLEVPHTREDTKRCRVISALPALKHMRPRPKRILFVKPSPKYRVALIYIFVGVSDNQERDEDIAED